MQAKFQFMFLFHSLQRNSRYTVLGTTFLLNNPHIFALTFAIIINLFCIKMNSVSKAFKTCQLRRSKQVQL